MTQHDKVVLRGLLRPLSRTDKTALRAAIAAANEASWPLYLVGGAVRDVLLKKPHFDIDLVVEGSGSELAERVAVRIPRSRAVLHPRFATAVVSGPDYRIDIATARKESYPRPGQLPVVQLGSIEEDLVRRDFTINAMALPLAPKQGEIIDIVGGFDDLRQGAIRVLHERSFRDDGTRILRAIRYARRFGFRIEHRTGAWLRRDLRFLDAIGGARLRREIELIAREDQVAPIVTDAERLGVWRAIEGSLCAPSSSALRYLSRVTIGQRDSVLFALLLQRANRVQVRRAIGRLSLTRAQQDAIEGLHTLKRNRRRLLQKRASASALVNVLETVPVSSVEAFAAIEGRSLAGRRARRYVDEWRHVRVHLRGDDVIALGVPMGPLVGNVLVALRDARLDGRVASKRQEEQLVRDLLEAGLVRGQT